MLSTRLQHLSLALLLFSPLSWAQPDQKSPSSPVLFATSIIKPWGMETNGKQSGLLIETSRALFQETGIAYENILRPYTRVFHELFSGQSDFALTFQSPHIDDEAIKVGIITNTRVVILALANQKPIDSLNQLNGFTVGHIRGSKYGLEFDQATHFTRQPINTIQQGLAMLLSGRIDAMAAVDHTIYWGMRQLEIDPEMIIELTSLPGPTVALFLSKKSRHQNLLPVYQQALEELREQKAFETIYGNPRRWLDEQ